MRIRERQDTEVEVASYLPLATYANAGKSIYLYLFIAFKCFPRNGAERARTSSVVGADHPRKRADSARCGLRDPWGPKIVPFFQTDTDSWRMLNVGLGSLLDASQSIRNFMMQTSEYVG